VGVVVVAVVLPPVAVEVDGFRVVGVPGVTGPVVVGAAVPPGVSVVGVPGVTDAPGVPGAPGTTAPVVVVGRAPGVVEVGAMTVLVTGTIALLVVFDPPLSLTSAAASTPSASVAITAIATIGAFQFVGAAKRVRAAAPQLTHHSCVGSSGAPHSGQAASTGAAALAPGVVVGGGGVTATTLKGSLRVDARSRLAGPLLALGPPADS